MGIGGNSGQQRKSSSGTRNFNSFFNLFKMGRSSRKSSSSGDTSTSQCEVKVWPSDEDKGRHWVAEPGIDRKAKAYIDRIHQIRVSETERQTFTLHP